MPWGRYPANDRQRKAVTSHPNACSSIPMRRDRVFLTQPNRVLGRASYG
jgi:hypothetical protein